MVMSLTAHSHMAPPGVGAQRIRKSCPLQVASHPQNPSLPTKQDCGLQTPPPVPAVTTAGPPDVMDAPVVPATAVPDPPDAVPVLPVAATLPVAAVLFDDVLPELPP